MICYSKQPLRMLVHSILLFIVSPIHFVQSFFFLRLFYFFILLSARARFKSIASTQSNRKKKKKEKNHFLFNKSHINQCNMPTRCMFVVCVSVHQSTIESFSHKRFVVKAFLRFSFILFLVCSIFLLENHNVASP